MTQGRTWQIAQVQRLVDMSRRDIQRACYDGKGGVGILRPHDSTWGRRSYGEEDLAELFVIARLRREGLSLPEIRRRFDAAGDRRGMLDVVASRLYEAWLATTADLLRAVALRADALDARPSARSAALARLFDASLLLSACGESLWTDGDADVDDSGDDGAEGADGMTPVGAPCEMPGGVPVRPSLKGSLEEAVGRMRAGAAADDPSVQRGIDALVAHVDGVVHGVGPTPRPPSDRPHNDPSGTHCGGADDAGALGLLERTLDMPGVDLILELWLGAGSHERLCEAVAARGEVDGAGEPDGMACQ